MDNFEQKTTYEDITNVISEYDLTLMQRLVLRQIIDVYSWMCVQGIVVNATYKDIVKMYLDDLTKSNTSFEDEMLLRLKEIK